MHRHVAMRVLWQCITWESVLAGKSGKASKEAVVEVVSFYGKYLTFLKELKFFKNSELF